MLLLSYDKLDAIPEAARGAYVEKDGKFVIDVELPDSSADKSKVIELERKLDAATKATKTATDAAADLQRKLDAKDATGGETDKKVAELLVKWEADKNKAVADAIAAEESKRKPLEDRLTVYDLDNVLAAAFLESGGRGIKKENAVALAKVRGWSLLDGKAVLKGPDGNPLTTNPKDYFGKNGDFFKAEPEWYEGSKGAGGAAPGSTTMSTQTGTVNTQGMDAETKLTALLG